MVTQDQIDQIRNTGRRSQGPLIDAALESLLQNGRNHKEAFAELGEALGMVPATVGQGFYRRKREKGEGRPMVRVSSVKPGAVAMGTPSSVNTAYNGGNSHDFRAILEIVERMVEARVNERLAEIRKVLG